MAKKKKLTPKDKANMILDAYTELGGKVSAAELSKLLKIHPRTIRYHTAQLKKKGHLGRVWPQTLDTKLGLGDCLVILDMSEEYRTLPRDFLNCFPNFYAHLATFGKYNGIFASAGFPLANPQIVDTIIRALERKRIIKDHFILNTLDFVSLSPNLSKYNPSTGWDWSWSDWVEQSEKILKSGEPSHLEFDTNPTPIDFDYRDVAIIAEMKRDGSITLKELSKVLDLSETQIGARIRRLKDVGVIKGFMWMIDNTPKSISVYSFLELTEPNHPILSCFLYLPFRKEIIMESSDRYLIRLTMNSSDVIDFLRGFEFLRPHLRSYFIQFAINVQVVPGGMHRFYSLYSRKKKGWDMPVEDYISDFERYLDKFTDSLKSKSD
ncbi:MAG: winged helix-turn-helix transcriptional regulator [Candidatus Thorarchaeota archaeon]|nr:winged helix-turn-helix transcriptional regulator [Candidatus Thorarchaeota archaeon]